MKYHFVRVVVFFVIALLVSGSDFNPIEWQARELALKTWLQQYAKTQHTAEMTYASFDSTRFPKTARDKLTTIIKKSGSSGTIDPGSRMREIAGELAKNDYGINPLELIELRKRIEVIREQQRAVTLADLNNYDYHGGPFVSGSRLKQDFFEYGITKHPALAREFPYVPGRPIADYLKALETRIGEIVTLNSEAFALWAGYDSDYEFASWNWYAWQNLPDAAVADWRANVLGKFGPVTEEILHSPNTREPQLASVVGYFNRMVKADKDAEAKSREKLNLGAINIDVPLAFVLLAFPLMFFGARALFRAMKTEINLVTIDLNTINKEIASLIGASTAPFDEKLESLRKSPYLVIAQRRYRELFSTFPSFFVQNACALMSSIAGIYVLYQLITVVFSSSSSRLGVHATAVMFTLSVIAIAVDLLVMWVCSRALAQTRWTGQA